MREKVDKAEPNPDGRMTIYVTVDHGLCIDEAIMAIMQDSESREKGGEYETGNSSQWQRYTFQRDNHRG